jgi:hypothetical protein
MSDVFLLQMDGQSEAAEGSLLASRSVNRRLVITSPVKYNIYMATTEKQKAARTLGRLGGLKGGKARADALTPERRKEIARNAVSARWAKSGNSAAPSASESSVSAAPAGQSLPFGRGFFKAKTIDQLIAEQGVRPVSDIGIFSGTIPDEDMDEFLADLHRDR